MNYRTAQRRNVPMPISVSGVSGSGKTYSALLLAAGLAGPSGKVGMLDTENGRGEMYADSPGIVAAMPRQEPFAYYELKSPFSPQRYGDAIDKAESDGLDVLVIDSFTHEWEGIGGCQDIAEQNKLRNMPNWAKAKREHKLLVNKILACRMHLIFCLRARDKARPIKGSNEFEQLGIQPITEKNFVYEMLISLMLDEGTHVARPLKVPQPLERFFPANGDLVTKTKGDAIRQWANGGVKRQDDGASLIDSAKAHAAQGLESYSEFWATLTPKQKRELEPHHEDNKEAARTADEMREAEARGEFANANAESPNGLFSE